MPGYISKAVACFLYPSPKCLQHSPPTWIAPTYSSAIQYAESPDESPAFPPSGIKTLQQIIGMLLYYAHALINTMLVAINTLSAAQSNGTEATMQAATHILNYCATHPDAIFYYKASDMVLHAHSDAFYLSASKARSRIGGFFFLSSNFGTILPSRNSTPVPLNGPFHIKRSILHSIMSSTAEAELGALFYDAKDACMHSTTLMDLGNPQQATPIQTNNSCAFGIANSTVKQKCSKAMDMRFYWVRNHVSNGEFHIFWRRGSDNLTDYFTKHHAPSVHRRLCSTFLHVANAASSSAFRLRDPWPLRVCGPASGTSPVPSVSFHRCSQSTARHSPGSLPPAHSPHLFAAHASYRHTAFRSTGSR